MSNNKMALKSGMWYTASNFLVKSIAFLTTPIFARLMTKSDFGLYNNFTSCLTIVTICVTLNLESTLISARYDHEDRLDEYIFSILTLSTLSAIFWLIVFAFFNEFFVSLFGVESIYFYGILIYLVFLLQLQHGIFDLYTLSKHHLG